MILLNFFRHKEKEKLKIKASKKKPMTAAERKTQIFEGNEVRIQQL